MVVSTKENKAGKGVKSIIRKECNFGQVAKEGLTEKGTFIIIYCCITNYPKLSSLNQQAFMPHGLSESGSGSSWAGWFWFRLPMRLQSVYHHLLHHLRAWLGWRSHFQDGSPTWMLAGTKVPCHMTAHTMAANFPQREQAFYNLASEGILHHHCQSLPVTQTNPDRW